MEKGWILTLFLPNQDTLLLLPLDIRIPGSPALEIGFTPRAPQF
jgi:hypothetical protein